MPTIKLTQGAEAIVDNCDFEWLNENKWHFNGRYAVRSAKSKGKQKTVYMHRLILARMGFDIEGKDTDHKNRDKLDNRRSNLRVVSRSVNCHNTKVPSNSSTGITGVSFDKRSGKYKAQVGVNNRRIYLGIFYTIKEAKAARKQAEADHPELFDPNHVEAKNACEV